MRRLSATVIVALLAAALLPSVALATSANGPTSSVAQTQPPAAVHSGISAAIHNRASGDKRVILIMAPYVIWEDITATSTPALWALAGRSAVGNVNAHSREREAGEPASPLESALCFSAGAWAIPSYAAAAAFNVDESYEVGTAAQAFRRLTGDAVGPNKIVFLGMPVNVRNNENAGYNAVLGTLGQAIEDAGGTTAAIGNSDVGYVTGETRRVRPAAIAAMDSRGLVALGDVSTRLLKEDPEAPFGIQTDLGAFRSALNDVAVGLGKGPALVVLDPGDSYRLRRFEDQVSPKVAERLRRKALKSLDRIVAMTRQTFPDDTLIIAGQALADPIANRPEGFGPIVINGAGWDGFLTSNSTHRTGVVTNLDVTATILDVLGIKRPVAVLGNEMTGASAPAGLQARLGNLERMNNTSMAVEQAKSGVINTFVVLTVLVLVFSGFVLVRSRLWTQRQTGWWLVSLRLSLLLLLAAPVSSWLMSVWMPWPQTAVAAVLGMVVTTLVVWAAGIALLRFAPFRVPVAALSLLTALVLVADQWMGGTASFTSFFGYSPLLGARFYGMGNEAAAILFGSSVVGLALIFDQWPDAGWVRVTKRWGLPVFAVAVVATVAAPFLGANVGVAVWGTIGFALLWVLVNGHHVSVKTVGWMGAAVVVIIAAFAAIDLYGGGAQTHLGRALTSAESGGLIQLWDIVARKAQTNMRVLTSTRWTYVLIAVVAFLGLMRLRPQGDFAETLDANPNFADSITAALVAGLVAYFTEDSGIVIPALELFFVGVAIAWLMLARARHREEPDGDS